MATTGATQITLTFDEVSVIQDALNYHYLNDANSRCTEEEEELYRQLRKASAKIDRAYKRLVDRIYEADAP